MQNSPTAPDETGESPRKGTKMVKVSKELAKAVVTDLQKDIEKVLAKHGMELNSTSTKYGDVFQLKIEASTIKKGLNGVNLNSREAQEFLNFSYSYGVEKPELVLGQVVKFAGRQMMIIGLNTRKKSTPVVCRDEKGNDYSVDARILVGIEK